jgi:cytochrome P450
VRQGTFGARAHTDIPRSKGYPLVGSLPRFWREPLSTLVNAQRGGGEIVRIDFGSRRFYLLSHPDHVQQVLQENAKNYLKAYDEVKLLLGEGLVTSEGASWLRQRRLMQPAFHRRRLAEFAATMVGETKKILEHWEARTFGGRPLDVASEMTLLTQRIIVKTMFGSSVSGEGEKIAQAFDAALAGIDVQSFMPSWFTWLLIPFNRRFERALATLDEEVYRIIRQRSRDGHEGDDLLSMLMEARRRDRGVDDGETAA